MKISECKHLNEFLCILFEFFKKNRIESSLEPIDDFDKLLYRILDSEFINYDCIPGFEQYSIEFKLNQQLNDAEVYFIIFGNNEGNNNSSLLVELGERELNSIIKFSWYEDIMPPFLKDFIDKENKLLITHTATETDEHKNVCDNDFMSFDDFKLFLDKNKEQKYLKWVEVD